MGDTERAEGTIGDYLHSAFAADPARVVGQDEAMGIVVESTLEWLVREVVGNPRGG